MINEEYPDFHGDNSFGHAEIIKESCACNKGCNCSKDCNCKTCGCKVCSNSACSCGGDCKCKN